MSPGNRGMSGHQSASMKTEEWYTPPEVFRALSIDFDLDPCAPPLPAASWIPAKQRYVLSDDDSGLVRPWFGRVWLNPPYGTQVGQWVGKLAHHGDGIALVFARTETTWGQAAIAQATAVCFIAGRLTFIPEDPRSVGPGRSGNSGAPSMLLAYGDECAEAVARSRLGLTFAVDGDVAGSQGALWEAAA